jgi:hypothetical protein
MSKEEVNAKKEQSPKSMVETFQATVDEAVHRALFDQGEGRAVKYARRGGKAARAPPQPT